MLGVAKNVIVTMILTGIILANIWHFNVLLVESGFMWATWTFDTHVMLVILSCMYSNFWHCVAELVMVSGGGW